MAGVNIYGPTAAPVVRIPPDAYVRVKPVWDAPWVWHPRLRPIRAVEQAGTGGHATFEFYYGAIKEHWDLDFFPYPYIGYRGAYVDIIAEDDWGWAALWVGIIPDEDAELWGHAAIDSGKVTLRALSLDCLLRHEIVEFPTEAGWIFRPLTFNATGRRGWTIEGNRSTEKNEHGFHEFSRDGEQWTNKDIVELLLTAYTSPEHTWELTGEIEALERIVDVHHIYRVRLSDALDRLIDRRRGLGWRLMPSIMPGGPIEVHVYSTLAEPVAVGEFEAPANPNQALVNWLGSRDLQAKAHFSDIDRYKKIVVLGGPIYSTMTLSIAGGGLEKGWSDASETAYKNPGGEDEYESDRRRASGRFDRVFRYFRVPEAWTGLGDDGKGESHANAFPACDNDANVDPEAVGHAWREGLIFERWLPWVEDDPDMEPEDEGRPDYMQPFAFIEDQEGHYQYLDRLVWDEVEYFMRLTLGDRELAVRVEGNFGHILAENAWEGAEESFREPAADYTKLGITAQIALDERLKVVVESDAPGEQTKTIFMPECVAWCVTPGTVEDIHNDDISHAEPGLIRDDGDKLRAVAALAKAWYGTPRATMDLAIDKNYWVGHPVGQLIRAAVGSLAAIDVGTVVTRVEWDFQQIATRIQTGFDELKFTEFPAPPIPPMIRGRRGRRPS